MELAGARSMRLHSSARRPQFADRHDDRTNSTKWKFPAILVRHAPYALSLVDDESDECLGASTVTYLSHKRKRVGRVVEQRIAGNFHFVELDPVIRVGQANWGRIADEMDLMARAASSIPSSVATTPEPPYVG